ncbi:MAG: hypothetical protein AAGE94_08440 [Acidobacteriota bacterium]
MRVTAAPRSRKLPGQGAPVVAKRRKRRRASVLIVMLRPVADAIRSIS